MIVDGVGTRHNFPHYIAHRPALAIRACKDLGDFIKQCHEEGREPPFPIPPFAVLMYVEMASMLHELTPDGVVFALPIPPAVQRWIP